MKKTLSVVLALVMAFVMCLPAFAAEKPADSADVAAWTEYYTELLADEETDPIDLAAIVIKDITAGVVDQNTALDALDDAVNMIGSDSAAEVMDAVLDILGITDAPVLPDVLPEDDAKLPPIFATLESILDTIFDAISGIIGGLFGGNSSTGEYCLFPTEPETTTEPEPIPEEPIEEVPDLGDNSLLAVGAVALVAGAALVLTRKKDAE